MRIGLAVGIWFAIAVLANVNGALREFVLMKRMSRPAAGLLSAVLLAGIVLAGSAFYARATAGPEWLRGALLTGLLWTVMTTGLEFALGMGRGRPISEVAAHYSFRDPWMIVVFVTAFGPAIAGAVMNRR